MSKWRKHPIEYIDEANDTIYLSIVFTWHLRAARARAAWRQGQGYQVFAGGPAVLAMPGYLLLRHHSPWTPTPSLALNLSTTTTPTPPSPPEAAPTPAPSALSHASRASSSNSTTGNPRPSSATTTSWPASRQHFDNVIGRLKPFHGQVDINQGRDARLLTALHAGRIAELRAQARLSRDTPAKRTHPARLRPLRNAGFNRATSPSLPSSALTTSRRGPLPPADHQRSTRPTLAHAITAPRRPGQNATSPLAGPRRASPLANTGPATTTTARRPSPYSASTAPSP